MPWKSITPEQYGAAVGEMQAQFQAIGEVIKQAGAYEMVRIGQDLLGRSAAKAPIDEGNLRSGGYAEFNGVRIAQGTPDGGIIVMGDPPPPVDGVNTVTVGFKAENANGFDYALVQHEHDEFEHPKGGQADYLGSTIDEQSGTWVRRLSDAVGEEVSRAKS